ncbi:hypothetical protein DFH06DRAFT_989425 [Mycena polygramma]|nr:hypothetical protein DFH06DRAFT_989425 [Mycena polygramma]
MDVAETSRAAAQSWRQGWKGTKGGAVQKKAATTNWFHPFLWGPIKEEMRHSDWSPSLATKRLHTQSPLSKTLGKGTISRWRVTGEKKWTESTTDRISSGKAISASGCTGILSPYPEITVNVKETLQGLRAAGAIVNVSIVRGLLIAQITKDKPELLTRFKVCSDLLRQRH